MIKTIKKSMPMSFAIKMLLTGFVTALGGSGYIGFLSEYATYFYAWNNEFRVPAEGSPYLKITISSITFMLIFAASILFSASYLLLEIWRKINDELEKKQKYFALSTNTTAPTTEHLSIKKKALAAFFSLNKAVSKVNAIYIILFFGAMIFVVFYLISTFFASSVLSPTLRLTISLFSSTCYIILVLPLVFPKLTLPASIFYAGFFLLVAPFALFNQNVYAGILSEIGYGGGSLVEIQQNNKLTRYHLLLRTTDSIFVKTDGKTPIEIPLNQINSINYLSRK